MIKTFPDRVLTWFDQHGRKDLPWQHPRSAYRVWISEIMLQQTQVTTVIPYFEKFIAQLPTLKALANAEEDHVLSLWAGLGYYSRARNLHRCAKICLEKYQGNLPETIAALIELPGIGVSTAGAIMSQAFDQPAVVLDGNVKRVLCRVHGITESPSQTKVLKQLWQLAENHLPQDRAADYTQAMMDLGATLCTRSKPQCERCPLALTCIAKQRNLQAEIPLRKSRKKIPQRQATVLLLVNDESLLLLNKRPPLGIWGGLWSLPQADDEPSALELARKLTGADNSNALKLAPVQHVFSHFKLHIHPLRLNVRHNAVGVSEASDHAWKSQAQIQALGLPAPIRKIVDSLWSKACD